MRKKKKVFLSYTPYPCPNCGANLEEPGAVIFWQSLPERATAHLEPGEQDGVIVILDGAEKAPEVELQCAECGADLPYTVEEVYLDDEFEEFEGEEEEGEK